MKKTKKKNLSEILADPKYQGRHLIVIGEEVFTALTGDEAARIFDRETKKNPGQTPLTAYIPNENTLILLIL